MTHNHTAFAREDVDDARRGAPAASLESWAADRGWAYRGSELAGAFATLLPRFPDYVFNACVGVVSPGRFGQVAHQLEELAATDGEIDGSGTFFGTRLTTKRGLLSFIGIEGDPPDEPFKANAAWAPTTAVILRVPEVALLPRLVIRTAGFLSVGDRRLDDAGLPGLRLLDSRWVDDSMAAAVVAAARPLGGLAVPYVSMVVDHGLVAVVRNGFVADPSVLDHLVLTAGAIADALAATVPVPEGSPGWTTPLSHEADAFARVSGELGMTQEDPVELHHAYRLLPFPGRARGLLRGIVPGTQAEGYIAFAVQGGRTSGSFRTVVLIPAAPGATTPLGGVLHQPTDQYLEVADDLAVSWPRARSVGRLDAADRTRSAVQTMRDLGLAEV